MCGIAGIIYRDGGGERHVGRDMTAMLQAMKHRGPDSTGYALYRPAADGYVMHVKLAESNGHHDFDLAERHRRQRSDVEGRMRALGADIADIQGPSEHAMTVTFGYDGDLKQLADYVEDVRGTEVLSLGKTLEIVKDLGDANTVAERLRARQVHRHPRHRPRADGDRVRRRHRQRPPVLGLSVPGRGRGAQRAAHELPPVEAPPGARRPPLPVRVRLRDHRRLPRRAHGAGRLARGVDAALASASSTASSPTSA